MTDENVISLGGHQTAVAAATKVAGAAVAVGHRKLYLGCIYLNPKTLMKA